MKPLKHCPGCGDARLSETWRIRRQPVISNYLFSSPEKAMALPRRDLLMVQCGHCGLIFNAALDPALLSYDENYENRQSFSAAFQDHLNTLADDLSARYGKIDGRVLEVGCGKGDFLRLFCERTGAHGLGYDTSYEGPSRASGGKVRFYQRYVRASDIRSHFDVVICRHVVEHVQPIGEFLSGLREIHAAAGDPVTVIETPCFEWIAENGCFWDVFSEHCNYFTLPCLAYLCERAGFKVCRHSTVFGGQYQLLELRLGVKAAAVSLPAPEIPVRLPSFARRAEQEVSRMAKKIRSLAKGKGWAIWGAAAKGVALVNRLRPLRPQFVIDANTAKQGGFIPGSNVPIVAPDDPRIASLELVLVANPNYEAEISCTLASNGFSKRIVTA